MINWNTLISSFDDPLTLLQWLIKLVEEQESQKVNNITLEYIDDEYYKIVLNYSDGVQVKSPLISKGEKYTLTLQELQNKIEGSDFISFDINEQGTKLVIALDKTHVDDVVTEDSDNLITSGAVFDAISGITSDSKLVEVTYGVTTYNEVKAIVDSGKIPYCFINNRKYEYNSSSATAYFFTCPYSDVMRYAYVGNNNVWANASTTLETVSNKEQTITSTSTTKYPSSKAVADYVAQHSGGGWTLLWENASPTSSFASQTLSINLTNVNAIVIEYCTQSGSVTIKYATQIVTKSDKGSKPQTSFMYNTSNQYVALIQRSCEFSSNTQLKFTNCNKYTIQLGENSSLDNETSNDALIPYKIYSVA